MNESTKILIEIQTDIRYIKEKIDKAQVDHAELEKKVDANKDTLITHIAKVKGFGILLGVLMAIGSIFGIMYK